MKTPEWDRRATMRISLRRPCKVFDPRGERYHAGTTADVAESGARVVLDRPVPVRPGDVVYLGIAATRRQPLLRRDEMVRATVRHAMLTADDRTILGLRFAADQIEEVHLLRAA